MCLTCTAAAEGTLVSSHAISYLIENGKLWPPWRLFDSPVCVYSPWRICYVFIFRLWNTDSSFVCHIGWEAAEEDRRNAQAAGMCLQTLFILSVYTAPGNTLRSAFNRYWVVFLLPQEHARCCRCSVDTEFYLPLFHGLHNIRLPLFHNSVFIGKNDWCEGWKYGVVGW